MQAENVIIAKAEICSFLPSFILAKSIIVSNRKVAVLLINFAYSTSWKARSLETQNDLELRHFINNYNRFLACEAFMYFK